MRSLERLLTIFSIFLGCLQVPSTLPLFSLCTYTSLTRITFAVLQKPSQGNFGKFQRSRESIFGGSEKYR